MNNETAKLHFRCIADDLLANNRCEWPTTLTRQEYTVRTLANLGLALGLSRLQVRESVTQMLAKSSDLRDINILLRVWDNL